jgi:hypothetical protein
VHNSLQVASFIPGFINRQIITLLLALGLDKQNKGEVRVTRLNWHDFAHTAGMARRWGPVSM